MRKFTEKLLISYWVCLEYRILGCTKENEGKRQFRISLYEFKMSYQKATIYIVGNRENKDYFAHFSKQMIY